MATADLTISFKFKVCMGPYKSWKRLHFQTWDIMEFVVKSEKSNIFDLLFTLLHTFCQSFIFSFLITTIQFQCCPIPYSKIFVIKVTKQSPSPYEKVPCGSHVHCVWQCLIRQKCVKIHNFTVFCDEKLRQFFEGYRYICADKNHTRSDENHTRSDIWHTDRNPTRMTEFT